MQRWEVGSEFNWTAEALGRSASDCWLPQPHCLFATGTAALISLVQLLGSDRRRIHVPSFFCMDVPFKLQKYFEVLFYQDLPNHDRPNFRSLQVRPGDLVLAVNFFGVRRGDCWQTWALANPDIILVEDHTQDPGSPWAKRSHADYCMASLHKTLPIPDGGILWSPKRLPLPPAQAAPSRAAEARLAAMLLKQGYLNGAEIDKSVYRTLEIAGLDLLEAEEPTEASIVTSQILPFLDFAKLRQQRLDNVQTFIHAAQLHANSDWWPLFQTWPQGAVPFSGVILCRTGQIREHLRQYLIQHQIFPAIHWHQRQEIDTGDRQAQDLAERILTLTLDYRYDHQDITSIMQILHQFSEQSPNINQVVVTQST